MQKIILASQSPRRKQLLEWAEIPLEIRVSEADETYPADLPIEEVPVFIARKKAKAVKQSLRGSERIILAADTLVVLDNQVIGKPGNRSEAIKILRSLSG